MPYAQTSSAATALTDDHSHTAGSPGAVSSLHLSPSQRMMTPCWAFLPTAQARSSLTEETDFRDSTGLFPERESSQPGVVPAVPEATAAALATPVVSRVAARVSEAAAVRSRCCVCIGSRSFAVKEREPLPPWRRTYGP